MQKGASFNLEALKQELEKKMAGRAAQYDCAFGASEGVLFTVLNGQRNQTRRRAFAL
jgi:hypothetical protein